MTETQQQPPEKSPRKRKADAGKNALPPAPSLEIVRRPIDALILDPRNARNHGRRDLEEKKTILTRFGKQKPIVIDAGNIVRAGNGFVMAARELGWTHIDCVITALTDEALVAYGIADNRSGELSDWDTERLLELVGEISDESLLGAIGFDSAELDDLLPPVTQASAAQADSRGARLQRRDEPTVRPVLSVEEVGRFEIALEATGHMNRAHALLEICDSYVQQKRQQHPGA